MAAKGVIDYYWVSLILGWMCIMVASFNPIIYILFNQTIRAIVFEFIGIKGSNSVTPMTTTVSQKPTASLTAIEATAVTNGKIIVISAVHR